MSDYEQSMRYPVHRPHQGLAYGGRQVATDAPVIPLMAFGVAADMNLMLAPREGDLGMLEVARVGMPEQKVWVALETEASSGQQTLYANLDDIQTVMPEFPVQRHAVNLEAVDSSTEGTVDVSVSYTSVDGNSVQATFLGDPPDRLEKKRNARVENQAINEALTVLDVSGFESLFKADLVINGTDTKLKKMGGFVPAQFAMEGAQGGLSTANYRIVSTGPAGGNLGSSEIVFHKGGADVEAADREPPKGDVLLRLGIATAFTGLEPCYLDRLEETPDLAGEMTALWRLDDGVVSGVEIIDENTLETLVDETLWACATENIGSWAFDPTLTGDVRWTFNFQAGDELSDPGVDVGNGTAELVEEIVEEVEEATLLADDLSDDTGAVEIPDTLSLANFSTFMKSGEDEIEMKWEVTRSGDRVTAVQASDLRTLTYTFRVTQSRWLELMSITVDQYGRATPVTAVTFNPPLPDVRWPFNGRRTSTFMIDVNGQHNHAYGEVDTFWSESGPRLKVTPLAPEWTVDRPLLTSIRYEEGVAHLSIDRVQE